MTTIDIYSSNGQLVKSAFEGFVEQGDQKIVNIEEKLAKGFYYIRLRSGDQMKVARLVVSQRY